MYIISREKYNVVLGRTISIRTVTKNIAIVRKRTYLKMEDTLTIFSRTYQNSKTHVYD